MENTFDRVKALIQNMPGLDYIEENEIVPVASLCNDLGIDELDFSELAYALKSEFGLDYSTDEILALSTVGELVMNIETKLKDDRIEEISDKEDNSIEFYQSLWDNDFEKAKQLLGKDINVNITTDDGWTPLLELSADGPIELIQILLDKGADPNIASNQDYTPLMRAAGMGQTDIVLLLLKYGADVTMKDYKGQNASRMARAEFQSETAEIIDEVYTKYLLEKHKDLSAEYHLHPIEPVIKNLVHTTRNAVGGHVHRLDVTFKNGITIKQCKLIEELVVLLPINVDENNIASYSIPFEQKE